MSLSHSNIADESESKKKGMKILDTIVVSYLT